MKKQIQSLLTTSLLFVCGTAVFADKEELPTVAGRIINGEKKPCADVEIRIMDEQGNVLKSDNSDAQGQFSCEHKVCKKCMLEIVPGEKTGLATALIENVAGDKSRTFMVELHKGFVVSGRVTANGKGLKGIVVKVTPVESETSGHNIHGGGFAITGRDGRFHMTLTPGEKKLQVYNTKYGEFAKELNQRFAVNAELSLNDLALTAVKAE